MENKLQAEAIAELEKVFILTSQGFSVQMFSKCLDTVWHRLLSDRDNYIRFSMRACGAIIVHDEQEKYGSPTFLKAYESKYGELPSIWFRNENGDLDWDKYEHYQRYGEIRASWRCSATHNCAAAIKRRPQQPVPLNETELPDPKKPSPPAEPPSSN